MSDNKPDVKLPPLPSNVYAKKTVIPEGVDQLEPTEREKVNKQLLLQYEKNEQHNVRAIGTARRDRAFINKTYTGKGN